MLLKMPSCTSRQHPKRFENQTNTRPRKWVNSNSNGARFKDRDRRAVRPIGIDYGGNLVVRADGEEVGLELIALADVDGVHAPRQAALFQHDVDFVAIGRGPRVDVDHG